MSPLPTHRGAVMFPLGDADRCVKCGLCLPHCPTYAQTGNEADSPRGRITLMQGLASGWVAPTDALQTHLDGCLSCRACEPVCPAKVPYGRLMDAGRAMLMQKVPARAWRSRMLGAALTHTVIRRGIAMLLWAYQRTGLQGLIRCTHLLGRGRIARLESLLPRIDLPLPLRVAATDSASKQVALFTGCVSELADRQTLQDALRVLARLNVRVRVPRAQGCCGALHQHAGDAARAAQLAQRNLQAFAGDDAVLCSASGCGASLLEYPEIVGAEGLKFSGRVRDLSAFIVENWRDLPLKPLHARVALHTPCTLKNVMRQPHAARRLLEKIPGLEIIELDPRDRCCGAAGSYFVTHAEMADALLAPKLDAIQNLAPDFIVSSNIGCALHLAAGARRSGLKAELLHPVSLLVRQLA